MEERGWEQLDFVYISGDAYVDHPSFGPAVITRLLEDYGYKVGIIAQPDWKDKNSIFNNGDDNYLRILRNFSMNYNCHATDWV